MDNTILLQILTELKSISDRLAVLEKEIKKNPSSFQPEVQQQVQGSSALAHLNSLGISY